jgi:hypothetical protein
MDDTNPYISPATILFQRPRVHSDIASAWKPRRSDRATATAFCRDRGRDGVLAGWGQPWRAAGPRGAPARQKHR